MIKAGRKKKKDGVAKTVLNLIGKIYHKEKQARLKKLSPEKILAMRQNEIKPLLEKIKNIMLEKGPTTPPKSLLARRLPTPWASGPASPPTSTART